MTIIQASLQPLLTWIQGPGLATFRQLEQTFQNQLPTAMDAFSQGVELLIRTLGFLAPYTGRLIGDLDKWLTDLNGADFGKFTGGLNTAIGIFRDWEGLVKAVGTAIYELFSHDAGTGTSLVVTLTDMVNHFNAWAKTVAGGDQLHALLESHKNELLAIIGVMGHVIASWGQLELAARPVLMDIVTMLADVFNFLEKIPGVGEDHGRGYRIRDPRKQGRIPRRRAGHLQWQAPEPRQGCPGVARCHADRAGRSLCLGRRVAHEARDGGTHRGRDDGRVMASRHRRNGRQQR